MTSLENPKKHKRSALMSKTEKLRRWLINFFGNYKRKFELFELIKMELNGKGGFILGGHEAA